MLVREHTLRLPSLRVTGLCKAGILSLDNRHGGSFSVFNLVMDRVTRCLSGL